MRNYVEVSVGQVHYREAGMGTGLVLLHQVPSSGAMWEAVLGRFAAAGFRAVAPDLPGYGMSDPFDIEPELEDYARVVLETCDALGVDRFGVLGHHTGASVALQLAHLAPDRLIGVAAWGIALLEADRAERLATEEPPVYDEDATEVVRYWRSRNAASGPALTPEIAVRSLTEMLQSGFHRHEGHRAVGRADHRALLETLPVPLLALAGDREMLAEHTRRAAELAPNATFRCLGDVGIDVADEAPEPLVSVVTGFLRGGDG